jgi:hypothetical protein
VPFQTLNELISYAKSNPRKLTFASAGAGSQAHLNYEMLKSGAGIECLNVSHIELALKYGYAWGATQTISGLIKMKMIPEQWGELGPDDTVPVLIYPHVINIAVCGDRTRNKTMALHAAYVKPVTKEIKLPENWGELTKKM